MSSSPERSLKCAMKSMSALMLACALAACGGGGGGSSDDGGSTPPPPPAPPPPVVVVEKPATRDAAARFLAQSTFGPVDADIDRVMDIGYAAWIDEQLARPATS